MNLVELLKQALSFYGDEENYSRAATDDPMMVELDNGTQAKFALGKIKDFTDETDEQEKEFIKSVQSAIQGGDSEENIINLINTYKTQTEKDGNV